MRKAVAGAIAACVLLIAVAAGASRRPEPAIRAQVIAPISPVSGFARAEAPRDFQFPDDHGAHPEFQTEWWYFTGNLASADGRRFGYQLTFFRRSLLPWAQMQPRQSTWATDQVYFAHLALSDIAAGEHVAFERFSRGAGGLAGAHSEPLFHVWLEDWRVEQLDGNTYRLQAAESGVVVDFLLDDVKGPVLQGEQGYSQKGPLAGNASYYYSLTRLQSRGSIEANGQVFEVSGLSWMDHEFSTSALSGSQVGWDWFALQLDDGSEVMAFQLRRDDGSLDPYSSGTFIAPDGATTPLSRAELNIVEKRTWRSPTTRAEYPAAWEVRVPKLDLVLQVEPLLPDQEMNLSFTYWEGAVSVTGSRGGRAVRGFGYVELTGYAGSMAGQF